MLYVAFDCVSTVNNVLVYLIDYLFVYVRAFTESQWLLLKVNRIQLGLHRSCVMENILHIDVQI